jgi:hypothetical protein
MIPPQVYTDYLSYGLSIIPCCNKKPEIPWKEFQDYPASVKTVMAWDSPQVACICGAVSGGLVCMDFDTKNGDRYDPWCALIAQQRPELLSRMVVEQSPSGGYHVIFRTNRPVKNVKLACTQDNLCTVETRGEGGYFVCAPSPNYVLQYGDFSEIKKISVEETEFLLSAAVSFNELVQEVKDEHLTTTADTQEITPFDDYDSRENPCNLLEQHGWKILFIYGTTTFLKRPGKEDHGISATWNKVPNRFYCFTTSTQFTNNTVYKASAVYTLLEHNGNYSDAAKTLYAKGYGKKITKPEENNKVELLNSDEILSKIIDIKINGYKRGETTGWKTFDKMFSVAKKQFTVITGCPGSGKSEFMDDLAVNLMIFCKWKFVFFSPENYPAEMHYHKLIEKICKNELRNISDENIKTAVSIINENFFFIDSLEKNITLESILSKTEELIKSKKIDALIIDPWNEIELCRPGNISESDFIGNCLRDARKFARKNNIHLFIVAHPAKMQRDKNGKYPIPELWDIANSAHFRNKCDNGIVIHRDYEKNITTVFVKKVKFKYCGMVGDCNFKYDKASGRYEEDTCFDTSYQNEY